MPQVAWDGSALTIGNSLSHGAGWLVTWVLQVLPLLFFAAGAAAGLGPVRPVPQVLRRRLPRMVVPVLALLGTWLAAALLLPLLGRSEEHTSELQSRFDLVCRLLLEKKKIS